LSGEYEVLVVPASSNLKTMTDLMAMYKANPGSVSWAGGLAGGVDQLTAGMIIQAVGGDAGKFNYVAFGSGGEVLSQTLGGHVTVGLGRLQRIRLADHRGQAPCARDYVRQAPSRRQHPDAQGARDQRRVRQLAWVDGGARHQRSAAAGAHQDRDENGEIEQWKAILEKDGWIDLFMPGDEFKAYVESEQKNVLTLVNTLGLVKK
jgi:putative tricarboxylic transport membrane protein